MNTECATFEEMLDNIGAWLRLHAPRKISLGQRSWFSCPKVKVYLRIAVHNCGGMHNECIDIASVEVDEEDRGKGVFTQLRQHIEIWAYIHSHIVFIESILDKGFYQSLSERHGYCPVPNNPESLCKVPTKLDVQTNIAALGPDLCQEARKSVMYNFEVPKYEQQT